MVRKSLDDDDDVLLLFSSSNFVRKSSRKGAFNFARSTLLLPIRVEDEGDDDEGFCPPPATSEVSLDVFFIFLHKKMQALLERNGVVCVNCGHEQERTPIYTQKSKNDIRLNHCEKCNGLIDKFVEYELTTITFDLILLKTKAFRHVLFNYLERSVLLNVGFILQILMMNG